MLFSEKCNMRVRKQEDEKTRKQEDKRTRKQEDKKTRKQEGERTHQSPRFQGQKFLHEQVF